MKLTKRETVLVFILLLLLVNYLGFTYLINGIDERINVVQEEINALEIEYESKQVLAENYVTIQSNFLINQQVLADSSESFIPYTQVGDINAYLEENVLKGLKIQNLTITYESIEDLELENYLIPVRVSFTTKDSIGKVMDTIEVIRTLKYKTYLKSFNTSDESATIEFYLFARK